MRGFSSGASFEIGYTAQMTPKLLTTLKTYDRGQFLSDLIAGATVAMVALPLSLAIAIASGAGPENGLVTAIVAGFLISLLGGSKVQIGGPTGAFIVVVFQVIQVHGYAGLVLATLMAGGFLILAGLLRLGRFIGYVPAAVINGFTIGIAVIIATSQIKDLFGLTLAKVPADFLTEVPVLWAARGGLSPHAMGIGIGTIVLIIFFLRAFPRWPGLIIALAATSALVPLLGLDIETIGSRFGALPNHLPWPTVPTIDRALITELLPSALTIAFLAGLESLLSATVADRMILGNTRANAELIAQGVANVGSSLFGGLPATGAIARTATNVRAGGKTPVAGLVHAVVLLLILLFAAPLAGYLAMPALAGLLILTAWNMSEPHKWRAYLSEPGTDVFLLFLTLILTITTDLTIAIGTGVAVGLLIGVWKGRVSSAAR